MLGRYLNITIKEIKKEFGNQIHSLNAGTSVKIVKNLQNGQKKISKMSGISIGNSIPDFVERFQQGKEEIKKGQFKLNILHLNN